jgi:uncharacterized protein Usg
MTVEFIRQYGIGYSLTTAHILYRMPDHLSLLQSYIWQDWDLFPLFPVLNEFLTFWAKNLDGPLFKIEVAHSDLLKPVTLRSVDGEYRLV